MVANDNFTVGIVGAGLVGSLAAVRFAQRGWNVVIIELRNDLRKEKQNTGRSINLALSTRGIESLNEAGVSQQIMKTLIPMKGRMIHGLNGSLSSQLYDVYGQCINSVDRQLINDHLLDIADSLPNVEIHFSHSLIKTDLESGEIHVLDKLTSEPKTFKVNLIVGCDGAYSKVRNAIMRKTRMNFEQTYIDHAWLELTIPNKQGEYALSPDHLHIWPRKTFMMIALPNIDKSFTVTLFMPWEKFDTITTTRELLDFFNQTFPDAVDIIGVDNLIHDFFKNPRGSLITVKCNPHNLTNKALILGDAAHAMVPFFGQGMNCGFEDVMVLNEILDKHIGKTLSPNKNALENALNEYSVTRVIDAHAICDLAMYNYVEMRSSVVTVGYKVRKVVEGWLYWLVPSRVIPLYTMVSFTRIPYSQALSRWKNQTWWLNFTCKTILSIIGITTCAFAFRFGMRRAGIKEIKWLIEQGSVAVIKK